MGSAGRTGVRRREPPAPARGGGRLLPVAVGVAAVVAVALAHAAEIRERAEAGLGVGMPPREAALARGFVLGEDEGVDRATTEDFRRSGLAHLLAVSGQNVALLALLAMPALAALGVPLRERLLWILGLIALYVPLAGAGPSIQRAAVMGAAGLLATLAGRRASRLRAFVLALLVTLAVDPGIAADVGWQLSFAAVAGIFALATPLRTAIAAWLGGNGWRGAVTEGAAVTTAATLATAPLIAYHFGGVSTTTLLANLLALPAVAPAMWLGMLAAALSQLPKTGLALSVLNGLNADLLAYIAQVAAWCGRPSWAHLHVRLGAAGLAASYAVLAIAVAVVRGLAGVAAARARRRRRSARASGPSRGRRLRPSRRRRALVVAGLAALALAGVASAGGAGAMGPPRGGLRVEVLDVGQGSATLLWPAGAAPVLVDGGPPGDRLAAELRAAGVSRLAAAVLTHDQSDHAGGLIELFGELPVERLVYAYAGRGLLARARSAGVAPARVGTGSELRSGGLRLDVLWPPREVLAEGPLGTADPNPLSLVVLAHWRRFSMLICGDAEAEAAPLDPGPVDVLVVAHHGSEDAGLAALLERSRPRLAVISVGEDNPYGLPAPATLATLAAHGVRTLRTDRDGTVVLDVGAGSVAVSSDG